jgi:hypothetical protein
MAYHGKRRAFLSMTTAFFVVVVRAVVKHGILTKNT